MAISGNNFLGHDWLMARRWWRNALDEKGNVMQMEFDVVAESVDHKYLLVGECKWQQADYAGRLLGNLEKKAMMASFGS